MSNETTALVPKENSYKIVEIYNGAASCLKSTPSCLNSCGVKVAYASACSLFIIGIIAAYVMTNVFFSPREIKVSPLSVFLGATVILLIGCTTSVCLCWNRCARSWEKKDIEARALEFQKHEEINREILVKHDEVVSNLADTVHNAKESSEAHSKNLQGDLEKYERFIATHQQ